MRIAHVSALLALLPAAAGAFLLPPSRAIAPPAFHRFDSLGPSRTALAVAGDDGDDYGFNDDWFAEIDAQEEARRAARPSEPERRQDDWGGGGRGRQSYDRRGSYGRGGGRGGGGYAYTRDTARDSSNVDSGEVERLLAERTEYKRSRDFDAADEIRDRLLADFNVGVNDRERTWRTGCSPSGSGMNGGYGRPKRERRVRAPQNFGPLGHDYSPSADAGPNSSDLTDERINSLLAARLQAKLKKDYGTADDIQSELIGNGVYVHDKAKEWRADGVPFESIQKDGRGEPGARGGLPNEGRRMRGGRAAYVQSPQSLPYDGSVEEINGALEERERCRSRKDFKSADQIRDYLLNEFNMHIDDRLREWSVGGDFGEETNQMRAMSQSMQSRGYAKAAESEDLDSAEDEEYIQKRVDERQEAKRKRDYTLADDIRDELKSEFGVLLHDKTKQWSVGGDFGDDSFNKDTGVYKRRGGGDLSEEDVETITGMITERHSAKQDRNFEVADRIRAHLLEKYGVSIDDFCNEWRVAIDSFIQVDGVGELSEENVAFVDEELKRRSAFKKNRDYASADEIRDALHDRFGIQIDDRTKEWRVAELVPGEDNERNESSEGITTVEDNSADAQASNDGAEEIKLSTTELSTMTVIQLKEMLRSAGKPVSGKKADLVDRLLN